MFKVNIGLVDRLLRLTLGEVFYVFAPLHEGTLLFYVFYFMSVAMMVTAITGHSFVYGFGGINTKIKTIPVFHKIPMSIYIALPLVIPVAIWYFSMTY